VEHFENPFRARDIESPRAVENRRFFEETLLTARLHRFFAHRFLTGDETRSAPRDVVAFVLTSFYGIVSPFTGMLCALGGRAPDLRSRFALMDNLYEEMGCGALEAAHPSLYLKMLASMGISEQAAEGAPALSAVQRINEHLKEVIATCDFPVACAVLASAEATIPPSFPVLAAMARREFPALDTSFFDRHGPRDAGHSDDAGMLFAVSADPSQFAAVEAHVRLDLDFRSDLFDTWTAALPSQAARDSSIRGLRSRPPSSVPRSPSVRPPSSPPAARRSVPPPR
jgi:hypothetical protein